MTKAPKSKHEFSLKRPTTSPRSPLSLGSIQPGSGTLDPPICEGTGIIGLLEASPGARATPPPADRLGEMMIP